MEIPILTISIPTYNRADLLDKTLASIYAQLETVNHKINFVISNNASVDHTAAVVEKYKGKMQNLEYVENPENIGMDLNISQAFRLAKTKYVWIFSDDDILLPNTLDSIVAFLEQNEVGVLYVEPVWYYTHIDDVLLNDKPFTSKNYENVIDFIYEINYWVSFITGNIVNKNLVQDLDSSLYKYNGTSLPQLGWILPAIFRSESNARIISQVILGRATSDISYKFYKVFSTNFNNILTNLVERELIPLLAKHIINGKLITSYFPQFILDSKKSPDNQEAFSLLFKNYWLYLSYWRKLFPLFIKRYYVSDLNKIKRNVVSYLFIVFNKMLLSNKYRQTDFKVKQLHSFGSHSLLPNNCVINNPACVSIGRRFRALDNLHIEALTGYAGEIFQPNITVGDDVRMGAGCHITCIQSVTIGNNVLLGSRVYITDYVHGNTTTAALVLPPAKRPLQSAGPVAIEDNVMIGEGACIMPGVTVGAYAIIGVNAVVTESVPAKAIVSGNPARVTGYVGE